MIPEDEGIIQIGQEAFDNCSGLTSVKLPLSVNSINDTAFKGCTGLKNLTVSARNTVLVREMNQPSLMLKDIPDSASQIIPIVTDSLAYQILSSVCSSTHILVQRSKALPIIISPIVFASSKLKKRVLTWLLCMKK